MRSHWRTRLGHADRYSHAFVHLAKRPQQVRNIRNPLWFQPNLTKWLLAHRNMYVENKNPFSVLSDLLKNEASCETDYLHGTRSY